MSTNHASDIEIQQYSFDVKNCAGAVTAHIEHCESCRVKARAYQQIDTAIQQAENPAFDFELAELVLSKLPPAAPKATLPVRLGYVIAFLMTAVLAFILILLKPYTVRLINDTNPTVYLMIIVTALIVTAVQLIDMYNSFRNKMTRLNLY